MTAAPDFEVAIIGAGLGGIGAAIALRRAGLEDLVIFERAADIGGTWRDNTYPGVGVDVPAQAYQFSYELKPDWSRLFASGREVKAYVDQCAEHHDVRRHVRLNSDVSRREWDDELHLWRLQVSGAEVTARFVISAIGAFVDPKPPAIDGLEHFEGPVLQSARWDHDVDLAGKRVAIVGTGASAVQIIPAIAGEVAQLDVYQRTPIWVAPRPDVPILAPARWLFAAAPPVQQVVRATMTRALEAVLVNVAVNNDRLGPLTQVTGWLGRHVWYRSQVRDADVRRRLTPEYELGCKRPAVSNRYLKTFNRPNVQLITEPITCVTPTGVQTADGAQRDVDVLILATGFRMAYEPEVHRARPVRGRDGFDLAEHYATERLSSYEGVSMPGLPNHFMIFGPYGWIGGTWHVLVETASSHIVRVVAEARRRGATGVEVREEAADTWTSFAREKMSQSLWHAGGCANANSYYFDRNGDTPYLRPTSSEQAKRAAETFSLDDYRYSTCDPPRAVAAGDRPRRVGA